MRKILSTLVFAISALATSAQYKMRPLEELISKKDPAWPVVKGWIDSAKNKVEILPADTSVTKDVLYKTQVTTRSVLGAVVYMTGGLLIDDGWIRILGSGNIKLNRTLPGWNQGKTIAHFGDRPAYLLVADDAIGGFFAINIGGLGKDTGNIYYLTPDGLTWEPEKMDYYDFIFFCCNDNLAEFYTGLRWKNWRAEAAKLDGNKAYHFMPPLYTTEGKDINKDTRTVVPIEELYSYNINMRATLGIDK